MALRYYLVVARGCVEPEILQKSYADWRGMSRAAQKLHQELDESDILWWLCVKDGIPAVGSFSAGTFL
jgi:hypothetical protein